MTIKISEPPLNIMERRFQALQDQAFSLPAASRKKLEPALGELAQAIAALRAAREAEMRPPAEIPHHQEAQRLPKSERLWPLGPTACPDRCATILSHLFMAVPDLFNVIDRDFNILMSNWHGLGESVPEAVRRGQPKCHQLFWGREEPCEDCQVREVFATGQLQERKKFHPPTGQFNEINAYPIRDEAGRVVLVAEHVRDITESHRAEEALRESETKYRTLVENIPQRVFIKDRDYRYVSCNQNFAQDLGIRPEEVLGKSDYDFFPRELADKYRADDQRIMATGQTENIEEKYSQEGKEIWVNTIKTLVKDENANIVGVLGAFSNISERKRAEQALKDSEERFRAIFELAPVGICIVNLQGRFLQTNRAFQAIVGYTAQELQGMDFIQITHPKDLELNLQLQQELLAGQRQHYSLEKRYIHKDGGIKWGHLTITPLRDVQWEPQFLIATVIDITARKQAEEALQKSEERFKFLFEYAPDAYFLMDLQGNFLDANLAAEKLSGYRQEEVIGRNFQSLPLLDDGQKTLVTELLVKSVYGEVVGPVELALSRKDGREVIIEAKGLPLEIKGQSLLLAIARDITARKAAEEALRESEQRFRDITENAAEWVWEVDAQGKYTYSSPVVEQLLGYKPEEVLDKHFFDFLVPDQREEMKNAALQKFAAKQRFRDFLTPNRHKNGQIVWLSTSAIPLLDERGDLRGYRGADIDITERREAEALSRNLIAKSPVGIYLMQNRKFQLVNQWFFTTTGYREDESLYLEPLDLVHPEDREATRANAVKMLKGLSAVPYEYRTITKGGETKWIMETLASIQYQGKRATLGYFMDITERKALEEQLLQAQKMEAVGRLAGGVAHDFNNLLMAIMGYSELMRAKIHRGDPLYDHLENILKAGERASALTQQLLTFSRRQIVRPQVIDLKQVILDLNPMLQRLLGEDIELEIINDPMPAPVKGDPGHLSQVIMNLVVNARDAMPKGGRLTLKTAPVDFPMGCRTRFGLTPPGAYVALEVRDTGVGMDEATQTHIFEPFFTTKELGKGTGLGLSTVYGIVKQSGGYLDLDSKPGQGSAFIIYLPRLEEVVQQLMVKIPITESLGGKETILLVEDEDVLRALLAKFLRLYGYAVLEARHGGEALLICERHQGPIHLMVTDVVMPQMSGRELADRLTPLRPEMQVLYMSGYTDDAMVHHGVADLSVPFLQKPFKPIELARQVHDLLHPAGQP